MFQIGLHLFAAIHHVGNPITSEQDSAAFLTCLGGTLIAVMRFTATLVTRHLRQLPALAGDRLWQETFRKTSASLAIENMLARGGLFPLDALLSPDIASNRLLGEEVKDPIAVIAQNLAEHFHLFTCGFIVCHSEEEREKRLVQIIAD